MTDLLKKLGELSPERRKLLEMRMRLAQQKAAGPELRPRPRAGDAAPLSFAQQRLWLLDRMTPGTAAYNMPHPLRIRGRLDAAALERALDGLLARHETLRTTFEEREGGPVQVIHPPSPRPLPVDDLSSWPPEEREAEVRRRVNRDANTGFDLVAGPLFRARLLRLGADEHVLLLCMHHIVSDGWSMGVLANELGALYGAALEGKPSPLAPLAIQYADFAAWQREHLAGDVLQKHLAFWRGALSGVPPALELPTDHPRPSTQSHRGATLRKPLPAPVAERLRALARDESATLFNVLLAALRVVLMRHSGQDDVVVGTPVANRTKSEVEGLIGFFVNTLPLRADVSGDPSFRELVRREKTATLAAFDHQDLPFERIVEELRLQRDPGRNPVFQAVMTLQNARMDPVRLAGVELTPLVVEYDTAKFDLTVDIYEEEDGGLRVETEWATDLFERPTVDRLTRHFLQLLERAVDRPDARRSELSMASGDEHREIVETWAGAPTEYPRDASIVGLFDAQVASSAETTAIEFGPDRFTYAELDARANRLAHRLRSLGVGLESRVGVSMERSADLVVAFLAILKAGGAYVPLDPSYPESRLSFMLEDAGVSALIVAADVPAPLAHFGGPVVSLSRDRDAIESEDATSIDIQIEPETLAYVVYTSGSTGTPKGIGIPHRAVVRLVKRTNYVQVRPDDRVAQVSNASFDAITFEVWGALLNGATLVGLDRETTLSPRTLTQAFADERITTSFLTTALFNQVAQLRPDGFRTLRHLLFGGEACDPASIRRVLSAGGPERLLHVYGPTESTTYATWFEIRGVAEDAQTVPIGRTLANTTAYVLDPHLRPVETGVPGELFLGGDGLARGYLGRPGMTAERFVPSPFSTEGGARLYRTGDRVRWTEDGQVEFVGRIDEQVKIRGFRIEPGEIEAALRQSPHVADCVVVVRTDTGEKRLVAYWTAAGGDAPTAAELREELAERLPDYMVPTAFVALDAIPLTPNGKVDKRALPAPEGASEDAYVAPRTETEEMLAGVWAEVLKAERVGIDDDFFLLGGHSLLATQVVARLRQSLGAEVPLRLVFEAPTVRRLAERVDALRAAAAKADEGAIVPVPRDRPLPVSFAQERVWFMEMLVPEAGVYNMPVRLRLQGALDAEALRRAFETVVARHEALRTRYRSSDAEPTQWFAEPGPFPMPVLEVDEDAAEAWLEKEAWAPFDLEDGPVIRASLLRIAPEDHVFALNMHHSVSDGWSLGVIFREVEALYAAYARGETIDLPPLPVQYADFGVWQRGWLRGERLTSQIEHWKRALDGAPAAIELPSDRPRPPRRTYQGSVATFALDAELTRRVREVAAAEGATLYMALLAAWQALLGRWAGLDDVVVGSPLAGRTHQATEGMVGFFVNLLPMRADLSGDPTFRALLAQVRQTTLAAYGNQDVPFDRLVEELKVERSLSHGPVFQVSFALQNALTSAISLSGVESWFLEIEPRAAKIDLSLDVEEQGDELVGTLEYATDIFEAETTERLLAAYRRLLEAVAADPDARVGDAPLLSDQERDAVLALGMTPSPATPTASLHRLFEARVQASPDAEALVFGGVRLSFAELNARANRIARRLREMGVDRETIVALSLERSPDAVAAMLAVSKAGGAFLPVDPKYPRDRRAYMLGDSGARVLVTHSALIHDLPELPDHSIRLLVVDGEADEIERLESTDLEIDVDPENAAYLIYTSGSTGRPKGVVVPHRGIGNLVAAQAELFQVEEGGRVLQFASMSFDAAVAEVAHALLPGGCLVLPTAEEALPGKELLALMRRERISTATLPPSVLAALGEPELPDLRTIVSAGEAVSAAVVQRWGAGRRFVNAYGPTETTVCGAICVDPSTAGKPPIGRPIPNTWTYVLDEAMRPVGPGVPGELYIGGVGVARGYLGRPGLTAERFVPDPFSGRTGARLYRTGDRARWLPSGQLEFLGRTDAQVKVRGFRIELGEVEAALLAHPAVRDGVVAVRADGGEKRLVAYAVAAEGVHATPEVLRAALAKQLPEHMVPTVFVLLPALPLTPNGKVDRRALPDPRSVRRAYQAPRTPTEEVLAEIWEGVLEVDRIGRADRFFDVGGHSLLATRVVSRVRAALQVDLPLRDLFDAPSLAALAERVDVLRQKGEGAPAEPIAPRPRAEGEGMPLSFAQERLWFIARLQPDTPAYNMPVTVRLRGALDAGVLRRALEEIVRRHEPLRTVFASGPKGPLQLVRPAGRFELPVVDLSHLAPYRRDEELKRLADEDAVAPFDLERGPLFRASLVRLGGEEHALLAAMHHIVSDGWSMEVFFGELDALYGAFLEGRESPLPELGVQYADYAAWQRDWLRGEALERQLGFWRARLADAPTLELPTDFPRPPVLTLRGAHEGFALPAGVGPKLEKVGRQAHATPFMTFLAVYALLLRRWSGQDDLVVGSPVAGRNRAEAEPLIGFFVNTVALRLDLSGDPTFRELLARAKDATLESYAHQDLPFERLVDDLKVERSLSRHPVFQVAFIVQSPPPAPEDASGLALEVESGDTGTTKFDLTVALTRTGEGTWATFEYASDLFAPETVRRMATHFRVLMEAAAESPDARVSELLGRMDDAERRRVLEEWSPAEGEAPARPVHRLFEDAAARFPGRVALVAGGERIAYAELDARANRLAHHLRSLGVGPEARVGIVVDRSAGMIESVLAVLKAGGAYVPLDPAYPEGRLRHMLEDSAVSLILSPASAAAAALPKTGARVVALDVEADAIARHPSERPEVEVDLENLAYVIYTSGSTGLPKGVLVPHRGVPNLVLSQVRRFGVSEESRVLQFASFSFDAAVSESFTALVSGGTLVLAPREALIPGPGLVDLLRRERITKVTLPPSVLASLPDVDLPDLATLISAGEAVGPAVIARWGRDRKFFNAYGPTENTIGVSCALCEADGRRPAIGRPFDHVRAYVLDDLLRPVPVGVPGELYAAGRGVTRGYHGRPGLTAERFVPDPFGGAPGARMYRTGDRARWRGDGQLEFLGRMDEQIKVRGFRVEPGEIVALLCGAAGVRDAVVTVRGDTPGLERLVAYVVPAEGASLEPDALREMLKEKLPDYMVPSAIVVVDELPLTPNGKVDRRALPAPKAAAASDGAAPRGELERQVAAAWAEVLGLPGVGVNDNFFEIGGHSLLLAQLQERLERALAREVRMVDLFRYPTVGSFAAFFGAAAKPEPGPSEASKRGLDRGAARRDAYVRRR